MAKTNGSALQQAREALAATNTQIAKLVHDREGLLLSDDDDAMLDAFDSEIDTLERLAKRHGLRIRALEVQAQAEEVAAVAKRKQAHIARIEKKLSESDAIAIELQNLVGRVDKIFRQVIALRSETLAAWPWSTTDQETCILTPQSIRTALEHELFRVGSRPFIGGAEFALVEVSLPGGKCPDPLMRQPDLVEPLSTKLRAANTHASRIMRGATSATPEPPAVAPATKETHAHG